MACSFGSCSFPVKALGLCSGHYQQHRKGKELKSLRPPRNTRKPCDVQGCHGMSVTHLGGKPYCNKHSTRVRTYGSPIAPRDEARPRAMAVIQNAVANRDRSECWLDWADRPEWDGLGRFGGVVTRGYPTIGSDRVMRIVKEVVGDPAPPAPGNHCRHMCDNKLCWNPDHLVWGTHRDNMQDIVNSRNYCQHCPHCNP